MTDRAPRPRTLRFTSLAEVLADAESFARGSARALGVWTPAQNVEHVRRLIAVSLDGSDVRMPIGYRLLGRVLGSRLLRGRALRSRLRPGFKAPDAFQPPADVTLEQALADLRRDVDRASRPGAMTHASPLLGPLVHEEWERLHCRHAELHFGFVIPDAAAADGPGAASAPPSS